MKKFLGFFFFLSLFISVFTFAQQANLDEQIALDNKVTFGKLSNGMTYYLRPNKKPEHRASLRLVVNAGSILEDDDQQGLAHFVEHMGFNGTKNFKKHELIDYLESIGMKFGPEVNAYTSFDETVYMIEVPTDSIQTVEKGLQILGEWAHNVAFEDDEIDKERGVIVEEWRLGRGAWARMRDKQFPILFKNSQYAVRNTIGNKEIIENFKHDVLRRFYKDWYRPDLMAVVAVGDFDKDWMEKTIKDHFSKIPDPQAERERKIYPVPDNTETLYAIATDPEATQNNIGIYYKMEIQPEKTLGDYRRTLIENLYNSMLNSRFQELAQKADPPFIYAMSGNGRFIRSSDVYYLGAMVKDNGIELGLETILREGERVKQFGFTQSELDREKKSMLSRLEQMYNERDKTESSRIINEYVRNFLQDEPSPGIEYEFEMSKQLLPGIKLEEINQLTSKFMPDKNRVVMLNAPEKKGVLIPDEKELSKVIAKVSGEKLTAYEDKVSTQPLVDKIPAGSKVVSEKEIPDLKITEWQLKNGVKVVLKSTDFKNDEVNFQATSPGGTSLASDDAYIPASTASDLVSQSGVGNFDMISLQKMLAGKVVRVYPYLGELSEGLKGSASPKDLETMFQLIYLYFTSPRTDSSAFQSYQSKMKSYLVNRNLSPNAAFQDTLELTLAQYNSRRYPWTEKTLDKMDLGKSIQIYKDRFADASDFTFVFVGNFDKGKIKPLIETYIGGLPSINRKENWKDLNINPPKGVIAKDVKKGIEPKSMVNLTFTGPYEWGYQNNFDLYSMRNVLDIKLREIIREEKGGTYGVWVSSTGQKYPDQEYNISITFGCSPARVNELVDAVLQTIDSLKTTPVDDIYITKVKETQKRSREVDLKDNNFWLNTLQRYYFYDMDLSQIMKDPERTENLSKDAIMNAAQKYFNMDNYVKVVLYPEKS
ncbi:MAG: insulinase family protein [Bacteroidetes bacterium]|nr:insulinase family protein [Bacteroidota bacterium]